MADRNIPAGIFMQGGIFPQELEYARGFGYASRMDMQILGRNIIRLRKHRGQTQTDFGEALGTNQATVSKWETKGVEPGTAYVSSMAEWAGVSAKEFSTVDWAPEPRSTGGEIVTHKTTLEEMAAEHGWVLVEELDLPLGMGATYLDGRQPEVVGLVPFPETWLRGLHRGASQSLKVVRGRGDSMEPTIHDGDVILIDTSHRDLDEQDVLWAVSYGNLGMIRRLKQKPNGNIMLNPDNQVVRSDEAADGELTILGRVKWIARRM